MNICYLVGAGDFIGSFKPGETDLVIAADGGFDSLKRLGIRCDLLVGDCDSIENIPEKIALIRHPERKDETDMYLAYIEGLRRGYTSFMIFGATGGREDHTFANYCLLTQIVADGHKCVMKSDTGWLYAVKNGKIHLKKHTVGKRVSVFAFGGVANGVSIIGGEYEGENLTLTPSFPLGVSNAVKCSEGITIGVLDGLLLIMAEE